MSAEAPRSFDNLPKVVQDEVSSSLGVDASSVVSSSVFYKVIQDAAMWSRVANKLNVKVTKSPKQDVMAYYTRSNNELLEALSDSGYDIPKMQDPFLQRRAIEDYFKAHAKDVDLLWTAVSEGYVDGARILLEGGAFSQVDILHLFSQAIKQDDIEMVKLFLEYNVAVDSKALEIAELRGHDEIAALLRKARAEQEAKSAKMEPIFILREATGRNAFNPSKEELQGIAHEGEYFVYANHKNEYFIVTPYDHIPLPADLFIQKNRGEEINVKKLEKHLNIGVLGQRLSAQQVKDRLYS